MELASGGDVEMLTREPRAGRGIPAQAGIARMQGSRAAKGGEAGRGPRLVGDGGCPCFAQGKEGAIVAVGARGVVFFGFVNTFVQLVDEAVSVIIEAVSHESGIIEIIVAAGAGDAVRAVFELHEICQGLHGEGDTGLGAVAKKDFAGGEAFMRSLWGNERGDVQINFGTFIFDEDGVTADEGTTFVAHREPDRFTAAGGGAAAGEATDVHFWRAAGEGTIEGGAPEIAVGVITGISEDRIGPEHGFGVSEARFSEAASVIAGASGTSGCLLDARVNGKGHREDREDCEDRQDSNQSHAAARTMWRLPAWEDGRV